MRPTPLTVAQKEASYAAHRRGATWPAIAAPVGCAVVTVRKWWRRARDQGHPAGPPPPAPPPAPGPLAHFAPRVATQAVAFKAAPPGWGARRVRVELAECPALAGLALPSRDRLAVLFRQQCPHLLRHAPPHPPLTARDGPLRATTVHEVWQLDMQEGVRVDQQHVATVCTIRDPFSAAFIASQAFDVTTPKCWRKLSFAELRAVLRGALIEWGTLPAVVQTDNELALSGYPTAPFPSLLTLWLVGLGGAIASVVRTARRTKPRSSAAIAP